MTEAEEAQALGPPACPSVSINACEVPILCPSGGRAGRKDSFHLRGSKE